MKTADVGFFKGQGFTFEHPGFINGELGSKCSFTVGHSDPKKPKLFTVQLMADEGSLCIGGRSFKKREEVVAYFKSMNPIVEKIGDEFAKVLKEWASPLQWTMMLETNLELKKKNSPCCASHDFCDANMAMDAAMRRFGIEPLPEAGMPEEIAGLWNSAWDYAKGKHLTKGE